MPIESTLYYGNNLDIMQRYLGDGEIDLVYLDPPFKSDQDYNVLFQEQDGSRAAAQVRAFEDTWRWNQESARTYQETVEQGGSVSAAMQAFRTFLGDNDMLAYLSMMAPRLKELHRVLKPTGSIYLHCDPTASHYLKMLMDSVFEPVNFRNEIIWKRTSARSDSHRWNQIQDTLLFYSKSDEFTWNVQHTPYDREYVEKFYRFVEPGTGRRYMSDNLTAAETRKGSSGDPWQGTDVRAKGLHWKYAIETLEQLKKAGRIILPKKKGGVPRYKRYLDEMPGLAIQSIITDIPPLSAQSAERLGYPTQKPEALLERIISASSNEGDTVLDPFCGCGTTISAAQNLNRKWLGIDITHLAISLIKHRLKSAYGDVKYKVIGEPVSVEDATTLAGEDPYQFQWWALGLVGARPVEQKKGPDRGIDGRLYFFPDATMKGKPEQIIFSVKAGHVTSSHVRDLRGVVEREEAGIGVLISLEKPSKQMRREAAGAGFYTSHELGGEPGEERGRKYPHLQLLTVGEILSGRGVECPAYSRAGGDATFRRAPKARKPEEAEKTKGTTLREF